MKAPTTREVAMWATEQALFAFSLLLLIPPLRSDQEPFAETMSPTHVLSVCIFGASRGAHVFRRKSGLAGGLFQTAVFGSFVWILFRSLQTWVHAP